jgi:iron(III) transport system permease protein
MEKITPTVRLRQVFILPSSRNVIISIAVGLFIGLCVLPFAYMFGLSFIDSAGNFSISNYSHLISEPRQHGLLLSSSLLGAGTAILATTIGAPLGLLLARADLPIKNLLRLAFVIPLVIPTYVLALAWVYIGGPAGIISQTIGRDLLSGWTYSLPGAVAVLGVAYYPLSMLATEAATRRVDGRLEEAALLVTGTRRMLWRITFPLVAPIVAATTLIIFVLAISEFGVPSLLRVPVFTTEVFTAFASLYDFGVATSLATPLLILVVIAAILSRLAISDRDLTTRRSLHEGLPLKLGRLRIPAIVSVGLLLVFSVLLPLTVLGFEAGSIERVVVAARSSSVAIMNSIMLASVGALLIVALAVLLGYFRGRARSRLSFIADLIFIVLFAVPSTVVGIGLIGLWNRPGIIGQIYMSPAIIVISYLTRFVPVAALIIAPGVRQVPVTSEEAASLAGASWPRIFRHIVFPQMRASVAAALVVAFIFAFGELGATVLIAPPGESTLPVRVYTLIANAPSTEVAALALMQAGIVLIPLVLFSIFVRHEGRNL